MYVCMYVCVHTYQGLKFDVVEEDAVDTVYFADVINNIEHLQDPLQQQHLRTVLISYWSLS